MHFCVLAFLNIFFSTENIYANTFTVNDIEISMLFISNALPSDFTVEKKNKFRARNKKKIYKNLKCLIL